MAAEQSSLSRRSKIHQNTKWLKSRRHQDFNVRTLRASSSGVSGNSRSRSFPRMEASDSLSRTLGMDFFIPFPFPNFGNGFFSFPSRSRILGMGFFHSLPIPEIWEWIFLFPSRSRISGMGFFNSLPVPEFREWAFSIPFPFPNPQKSFPLTPEYCPFSVTSYPVLSLYITC